MFELSKNSIGFEVIKREFGKQDRGVSPKGANDQCSVLTALYLLGNPVEYKCCEILLADEVKFTKDVMFTLTGAHYKNITLNSNLISHSKVYEAKAGDILKVSNFFKGYRLYIATCRVDKSRLLKESKPYSYYFPKQELSIRVIKGIENEYLEEDFFAKTFSISTNSDISALRLDAKLKASKYDIITSAVTDGTIQLTKDGPIILMRHRQSTGGYPRVFNVIEADIDKLAQYKPNSKIKFELVDIQEAKKLLLEYEDILQQMKEDLA